MTGDLTKRLGRLPEFDERSRSFSIAELLPEKKPRSYTWGCKPNLDQGSEGACVGFSWSHELAARPVVKEVSENLALGIYHSAQKLDEWDGEDYDGTSVLAGAKAVKALGFLDEYRWAFGLDDVIKTVGYCGPVVLGINWYTGMFGTDRDGYVRVTGTIAGGHAILLRGIDLHNKRGLLHNSWGPSWGGTSKGPGTAWISLDDLDRLLHERGEACIPVRRR